ncbi:hypothetical protein [Goodfellowiella coeruleoviolacea]|uniref:hypothetical protein n=1 Tax=Goodfellowiella coeruleoviolacea TaxID=334858 RepID=UPI0020A45016|nr:hypothetical protein [Goodfellowiella coeruleoviolacea]
MASSADVIARIRQVLDLAEQNAKDLDSVQERAREVSEILLVVGEGSSRSDFSAAAVLFDRLAEGTAV